MVDIHVIEKTLVQRITDHGKSLLCTAHLGLNLERQIIEATLCSHLIFDFSLCLEVISLDRSS